MTASNTPIPADADAVRLTLYGIPWRAVGGQNLTAAALPFDQPLDLGFRLLADGCTGGFGLTGGLTAAAVGGSAGGNLSQTLYRLPVSPATSSPPPTSTATSLSNDGAADAAAPLTPSRSRPYNGFVFRIPTDTTAARAAAAAAAAAEGGGRVGGAPAPRWLLEARRAGEVRFLPVRLNPKL